MNQNNESSYAVVQNTKSHDNSTDAVPVVIAVVTILILTALLFSMCRWRHKEGGDHQKFDNIPELDLEEMDEVRMMKGKEDGCSTTTRTPRQKRFASISVISRELLGNHLRGTADRVESDESSLEMDSDRDEEAVDCIDTDSDDGEGVQIVVRED